MSASTCPGNDPLCPCHDGAACHYRDDGRTKGFALPYDVSRCAGVQYDGDWREGCEDCLRRTSPGGPMSPWIEAPVIVVFECEYRIAPEDYA